MRVRRSSPKVFAALLDLPGHCAAQNAVTAENAFERTLFLVEFGELLLDRNGGQTSKLAEPDFKNVVRLTISETELLNQSGFGSSLLRMISMTRSMLRRTSARPSST